MKRLIVYPALVVALALAAACGGGGGSGKTPGAETPLAPTVEIGRNVFENPPRTPTAREAEVIASTGDLPLEIHHHDAVAATQGSDVIDFPFDIALPKGWEVTKVGIAVTASIMNSATFPFATITVDCVPGVDKGTMLGLDGAAATRLGLGGLEATRAEPAQVGGKPALQVAWEGSLVPGDRLSVYVDGKDCAWRIQLASFGAIPIGPLLPMFNRVLAAFNPDQGL